MPDGYLNTYHTTLSSPAGSLLDQCRSRTTSSSTPLEATGTHHHVTKSTRFLDIMTRYIDYICTVFGPQPGQIHGYATPGTRRSN
jgi:DUF1680 family protein